MPKMSCSFLTHQKKHSNASALDLTRKPTGCGAGCGCVNCIMGRLGGRDMHIKHWPTQGHFPPASPPMQLDHNSNQFKPEPPTEQTRMSPEPAEDSPNKIRRASPEMVFATAPRLSPQGFVHHHHHLAEDPRRSPYSPSSSNRSSPVNGYYRSSVYGVPPDAYGPEPTDPTSFNSQHLPLGMISPQQLSLNAWFTLYPSKTSPTSTLSTPERQLSSEEGLNEDTRSSSSSPAARSLASPDPQSTAPKNETATAAKKDKNSVYWQRRLRNNMAAKRSRDLRRQREDRIASDCLRMDMVRQRLHSIRLELLKLLT